MAKRKQEVIYKHRDKDGKMCGCTCTHHEWVDPCLKHEAEEAKFHQQATKDYEEFKKVRFA